MNGSAPRGALGPVTSLRAVEQPRRPHSHGDRKSGRLAVSDRDGAVRTAYRSADEWPKWCDAWRLTVSLTGGA